MSYEIEKEHTYTLLSLPADIETWDMEFLADLYIPDDADHPHIRLRQRGESYCMTRKYPETDGDASVMIEETITLDADEFAYFMKHLPGKYLAKKRYKKIFGDVTVEVDAYQDTLSPLMVVDFEWTSAEPSRELLEQFAIGKNITQVTGLAAGMLAGRSYADIEQFL